MLDKLTLFSNPLLSFAVFEFSASPNEVAVSHFLREKSKSYIDISDQF